VSVTAKEFFESLPSRADGSRMKGIHASYVFAVDGGGTWTVRIEDGQVSVVEGDAGGDCTVTTSEKVFERILSGKQNPMTAYLTGKLKVHGDLGAAMKLQKIF
jgi:putative sterol carrier protein